MQFVLKTINLEFLQLDLRYFFLKQYSKLKKPVLPILNLDCKNVDHCQFKIMETEFSSAFNNDVYNGGVPECIIF